MMNRHPNTVLFHEEQAFRQPWLWLLLLPISIFTFAIFAYGLYEQIYRGRPFGDRPMSDAALIIAALLFVPLAVGLLILFWRLRLTVVVDQRNLYISFSPFVRRTIPVERIARWEVRTYQPIREYGGWGVRLSFRGRGIAYNVSGKEGVQVYLTDGSQLLIGSHRPQELTLALEQARES